MPWTKILIEKEVPDFDEHADKDVRKLTVPEAIRETLDKALGMDRRVFVMGQGVDDPSGMFGMTLDLQKKYGKVGIKLFSKFYGFCYGSFRFSWRAKHEICHSFYS